MLKNIYTVFLGLLLALFIGLGINTFYEGPKQPDYPTSPYTYTKDGQLNEADAKKQREYEESFKKYDESSQTYSRNVSVVALTAALIMLVLGLMFEKRNYVIGGGILLGGLFTLVYSIIRGFVSTDTKYTFIVVTVGVLIALYLGYRKFSEVQPVKSTKKIKK